MLRLVPAIVGPGQRVNHHWVVLTIDLGVRGGVHDFRGRYLRLLSIARGIVTLGVYGHGVVVMVAYTALARLAQVSFNIVAELAPLTLLGGPTDAADNGN